MARKTGSHSDITGPKIREAALKLFARHGYAAVSMRQIAAEVGLQAGALYLYTPDKQSLLSDLMADHLDLLLAEVAQLSADGDPLARLEAFVRFHIDFHLQRPEAVFIAYMELRNLELANFQRIEAMRSTYESHLEAILRAGVATGAFKLPDARLATMALIAMLTGVTTWYREGGRLGLGDIAQIYVQMARQTVGVIA